MASYEHSLPLRWEGGGTNNFMDFADSVCTLEGDRTNTGTAQASNLATPTSSAHAHAPPQVSGNQIFMIPAFSGEDGAKVETFLEHLRIVSHFSGWNEVQTLSVGRLRLTGLAAEFVTNHPHVVASYANFEKYLRDRFSPKFSRSALEKLFNDCTQNPLESVSDFSGRLRSIERQLRNSYSNPDSSQTKTMFSERLLAQFLAGLRQEIGRFVVVRNPRTMLEAEEYARLEEAASKSYATAPRFVSTLCPHSLTPAAGNTSQVTIPSVPTCGFPKSQWNPQWDVNGTAPSHWGCHSEPAPSQAPNSGPPYSAFSIQRQHSALPVASAIAPPRAVPYTQRPAATRVCYQCGHPGHFARNCREKTRGCYNCGETGHSIRNCSSVICGKCRQNGHLTLDCPQKRNASNEGNA